MSIDRAADQNFNRRAMQAEMLSAEDERALALAWRDDRDEAAELRAGCSVFMALPWRSSHGRCQA